MLRKIISGSVILVSSILLGLSIAAILSIWIYRPALTETSTTRLQAIDSELAQAQTTLQSAELELDRTLRTVEAADKSLAILKDDFTAAQSLFGVVNGTLDNQLLPGLKNTRDQINQAKNSLQDLRDSLAKINSLPFANLNIPGDQILAELISGAGSLDSQITQVEDLIKQASTFVGDASYLMGGDLTETKTNLENFVLVVKEYDQKISDWRAQLGMIITSLPGWIETTSIWLTVFLLWFALSQVALIQNVFAHAKRQRPQPAAQA